MPKLDYAVSVCLSQISNFTKSALRRIADEKGEFEALTILARAISKGEPVGDSPEGKALLAISQRSREAVVVLLDLDGGFDTEDALCRLQTCRAVWPFEANLGLLFASREAVKKWTELCETGGAAKVKASAERLGKKVLLQLALEWSDAYRQLSLPV